MEGLRRAGFILNAITAVVAALVLGTACTYQFKAEEEPVVALPIGKIKPEIDYSNESPGCELAAERISAHVEVGMALVDVRRLVGQPQVILPSRWLWTKGFTVDGRPMVSHKGGPGDETAPITAFSTDTSACQTNF